MKKTFTANLNGTVFHIEEDAYDQLQRYLANIRAKFSGSAEAEEIMADIEARIAELFTERLQGRQAVSLADVDHVKQVMGQPEDYVDGDTADRPAGTEERTYQQAGPRKHKRLFRDPEDRWVGGVISGLANYFGTDPLWFRIAFIVVLIAGWGSPVLVYLIMWALIPEASTAAEKLEMHGEEVTVDNIKRVFEEGAERVKAGAEKVAGEARAMGRKYWQQGREHRHEARYRAESIAHRILDALGKVVGLCLLFLAIILGLSLIAALVGGTASWTTGAFTGGTGLVGLMGFIFPNGTHAMGFTLAAVMLCLVPVILLLLAALWLLFRVRTPRWVSWCLSLVFILAVVAVTWSAVCLAADFRSNGVQRSELAIPMPANGTLDVRVDNGRNRTTTSHSFRFHRGVISLDMDIVDFEGDSVVFDLARLNVEQSPDSAYHLVAERLARGADPQRAGERADRIRTSYSWKNDMLSLSSLYSFPIRDRMRAQHVNYFLQVPLGGRVHFASGTERLMHDWMNGNEFDGDFGSDLESDMAGHTWIMTEEGLKSAEKTLEAPPVSEERGQVRITDHAMAAASVGHIQHHSEITVPMPNLLELLSRSLEP
jgi:phage shock protein PspC (stress-responsive transcriptional regulator)